MQQYDYIIAGTGCAGLSLAMHMIHSGKFNVKKIALVDETKKNTNDRTWCFWEKKENIFEPILFKSWDHLWFYGDDFYKDLAIKPYRYKMIRGIDFYKYCFEQIKQHPNFEFIHGKIESIFSGEQTGILVNGKTIYADNGST